MVNELRQVRGDRTQKEMAQLLGISQTYYGQLELGVRTPSFALLRRMSAVFQISGDQLLMWWSGTEALDASNIAQATPRRVARQAK
jgi:transcriptional regulator with XRE-family HTH domain